MMLRTVWPMIDRSTGTASGCFPLIRLSIENVSDVNGAPAYALIAVRQAEA
jgi:hypothetical protein